MTKKEQERLEQEQKDFEASQCNQNNDTLINHDPQPTQRVDAVTLMRQSNENTIKMGATCADIKVREGGPMLDRETKQQKINPQTNEPLFYSDKFYATLTFDGGQIDSEITKEQKDLLEIGSRYSCSGRLSKVKIFVNGGMAELDLPVYYEFTKLY